MGASRLILKDSPEAVRFAAVGKVGGCSGAIVRPDSATDSSPAYLLTAGHCVDLGTNDVYLDRRDTRPLDLQYYIGNPASERRRVRSRRVVYSTMKGMDIALLELDVAQRDVPAAALSAELPRDGEGAEWAGVPTRSIPSDEQFLRTSACTVSGLADVLEWRWSWRGMLRNDCSDISGGASGSPLFSKRTGRILGVISTTNVGVRRRSGDFPCWRDNPCETTGYRRDTSYASPVHVLTGCFTAGLFDLNARGCGLDPGRQATVLEPNLRVKPGERWNTSVSSDLFAFYRYKTFREGSGDCAVDTGYTSPQPLVGTQFIADEIGDRPGRYYLCVLVDSQPARFATVSHLAIDDTKPEAPPELTFLGSSILPAFRPPDIALIPIKFETSEENTCNDPQGYRDFYPSPLAIPAGAQRACLVAADMAGNRSEPYSVELRRPALLPRGVASSAGNDFGVAAPGSWITLYGLNLRGADLHLVDSLGRRHELAAAYQTSMQMNARVPEDVAAGDASVRVDGTRIALRMQPLVPGIFQAVPVEARVWDLYASGLGRDGSDLKVRLAGQELELLEGSELDGVYKLTVRIPEGLSLRGFVPFTVEAGGLESREEFVQIR